MCIEESKVKKYTKEEIQKILDDNSMHLIICGEYKNVSTKVKVKCTKCGFEYEATPYQLKKLHGCPICNHGGPNYKKSSKDFEKELKQKNPDVTLLGEYINSKEKVLCKCNICGKEFLASPNHLLHGQKCRECGRKQASENKKKHAKEEFYEKIKTIKDLSVEIIGEYIDSDTRIEVKCKTCGRQYSIQPSEILRNVKCAKCQNVLLKTEEEFIKQMKEKNPHLTLKSKYINSKTKVKVLCDKCGKIHTANPYQVLRRYGYCPNSHTSQGESCVGIFLEKSDIKFIPQYKFPDCKDKRPLPFDFYLPEHQVCIEYDGSQHQSKKDLGRITKTEGKKLDKLFKDRKKKDKIKDDYCLNNNIKLIRITLKGKALEKYLERQFLQELLKREEGDNND